MRGPVRLDLVPCQEGIPSVYFHPIAEGWPPTEGMPRFMLAQSMPHASASPFSRDHASTTHRHIVARPGPRLTARASYHAHVAPLNAVAPGASSPSPVECPLAVKYCERCGKNRSRPFESNALYGE